MIKSDAGPDVFVHYSSILVAGFKSLQSNDEVEFSVKQGKHGPMAVGVVKIGDPGTGKAGGWS